MFEPDADSEQMLRVYGDREVMQFVPGGALADDAAVRSQLEGYSDEHRRSGLSSWAIVLRESGALIGDVGFRVFEPTGDVEIGYTLARDHWGRGYATEAASACLAAAFIQLTPPRIIAVADERNVASHRVAERIGMARVESIEAYGRPHVLFATPSGLR